MELKKKINIHEDNCHSYIICPPSLIHKYYTYTHDYIGHIYTLLVIMVMPCI